VTAEAASRQEDVRLVPWHMSLERLRLLLPQPMLVRHSLLIVRLFLSRPSLERFLHIEVRSPTCRTWGEGSRDSRDFLVLRIHHLLVTKYDDIRRIDTVQHFLQ
jgi:hypothetical protein